MQIYTLTLVKSNMQENADPSVAFTVLVKREGNEASEGQDNEEALVNVTHEAVTGAVQDVSSGQILFAFLLLPNFPRSPHWSKMMLTFT